MLRIVVSNRLSVCVVLA